MQTITVANDHAREVFVTAVPPPGAQPGEQAERLYRQAGDAIRRVGGRVVQERLFASADAVAAALSARAAAWSGLDDGVPPAVLLDEAPGRIAGLQVHAVCSPEPVRVERLADAGAARVLDLAGLRHVFITGLLPQETGTPANQAQSMFQRAERLLSAGGAKMTDVARTWLWLGNILDWYGELNRVRNEFFRGCGLIGPQQMALPASTGIGVAPAGGEACAIDLRAIRSLSASPAESPIRFLQSAGRQDSAFRYGSAFSRAALCPSPAGQTLFISGTAAIDAAGVSRFPGDTARQIDNTLGNVKAILAQNGFADGDVVQAMAYCKTPAVEAVWRNQVAPTWPIVTMVSAVCRDELLFEVELMAVRGG